MLDKLIAVLALMLLEVLFVKLSPSPEHLLLSDDDDDELLLFPFSVTLALVVLAFIGEDAESRLDGGHCIPYLRIISSACAFTFG